MGEKVETANTEDGGPPAREGGMEVNARLGGRVQPASSLFPRRADFLSRRESGKAQTE